jgi:membrane-bound metal-dependent hydrolase YbcI (DUF457 family)
MLPWGHAAVGYLCYTLWLRLRARHPPAGPAVVALAVGTQFPDLVDKPLAWTFEVLPSGRSLGHSLIVAGLLAVGLRWAARRFDRRREAGAFLCGYVSHIVADIGPAAVGGEWMQLRSLAWPLLPVYVYPGERERSIIAFLLALDPADIPVSGLVLSAVAFVVWMADGRPGLGVLSDRVSG